MFLIHFHFILNNSFNSSVLENGTFFLKGIHFYFPEILILSERLNGHNVFTNTIFF